MVERILKGDVVPPDPAETVQLVPLALLTDLARLGLAMRKAQRAYFEARKRAPHMQHNAEWRDALDTERRFDSAVRDALARERLPLPGMGG